MRHLLGAAVALLCLGSAASAEPEGSRLDGAYAGVVGGYATSAIKADGLDVAGNGAFGGAVLGYGVVANGLYWGLELDAILRDIKPSVSDGTTTVSFSNKWMGTARARVGLPIAGVAMLYGTAGLAATESKLDATGFGNDNKIVYGLAAGGGLEAALTKTISVRMEALHYAFPSETFNIQGVEASIKQGETIARVGLSVKLN